MSTQVRERLPRTEARRMGVTKMPFGLNAGEAIAAVVALIVIVWVTVTYLSSLKPEKDQLRGLEKQLSQQQQDIIANVKPDTAGSRTPAEVAKDALESLDAFENGHLKQFSSGRIDLIKEINALAKKNNASLTSGIDMGSSAEEANAEGANGAKKSGQTRKKSDEISSAFPSVNFRFTVFGQYSNLRSFINDLEHQKQFLVINSVNLTNQEERVASRRARSEASSGIMLTLEMSAYFQPAG